jgi:hypothetical protein
VTLTNGATAEIRAWPTPVPGLLIGERPLGGWVIACESARAVIGLFGDPDAALACAIEIGPLAAWGSAGDGRLGMPRAVIDQAGAIIARWGGGRIDVKGAPRA